MTSEEALKALQEFVARGWKFEIRASTALGWEVDLVGKGLANWRGWGLNLGRATEMAVKGATSMEDDPLVVLEASHPTMTALIRECFGERTAWSVSIVENEEGFGPKRILLSLHIPEGRTPQEHVDREGSFFEMVIRELSPEFRRALRIETVWGKEHQEEPAGGSGAKGEEKAWRDAVSKEVSKNLEEPPRSGDAISETRPTPPNSPRPMDEEARLEVAHEENPARSAGKVTLKTILDDGLRLMEETGRREVAVFGLGLPRRYLAAVERVPEGIQIEISGFLLLRAGGLEFGDGLPGNAILERCPDGTILVRIPSSVDPARSAGALLPDRRTVEAVADLLSEIWFDGARHTMALQIAKILRSYGWNEGSAAEVVRMASERVQGDTAKRLQDVAQIYRLPAATPGPRELEDALSGLPEGMLTLVKLTLSRIEQLLAQESGPARSAGATGPQGPLHKTRADGDGGATSPMMENPSRRLGEEVRRAFPMLARICDEILQFAEKLDPARSAGAKNPEVIPSYEGDPAQGFRAYRLPPPHADCSICEGGAALDAGATPARTLHLQDPSRRLDAKFAAPVSPLSPIPMNIPSAAPAPDAAPKVSAEEGKKVGYEDLMVAARIISNAIDSLLAAEPEGRDGFMFQRALAELRLLFLSTRNTLTGGGR